MKKNKPTSPRVQRNREAMKQDILDTARGIMREEGVAALSIHELARRLEIRPPSLYNYYNSKMEIYDELFRLGFELFSRAMQEAWKLT
jgi:AcrR family transcriptional regulator